MKTIVSLAAITATLFGTFCLLSVIDSCILAPIEADIKRQAAWDKQTNEKLDAIEASMKSMLDSNDRMLKENDRRLKVNARPTDACVRCHSRQSLDDAANDERLKANAIEFVPSFGVD